MKVRSGFVSNSSSSSFIIVSKKGTLKKEMLEKIFELPEEHILATVAEDMAECLLNNSEVFEDPKALAEELGKDEIPDWVQDTIDSNHKAKVYSGSVSDDGMGDGNRSESLLCDLAIDYEDENIIVKKEGGY